MSKYVSITRKQGLYKGFDILIEYEDDWLFYSVLDTGKKQVIGGYRNADVDMLAFYNYLEKQVDEYICHPLEYREDDHDIE